MVSALRLAFTFHLHSGSNWCADQESALAKHLAKLRADDDDFDSSVRAFHSSGVAHNSGGGSGPAALRLLRVLGAYDALSWAVWALACRQGKRVAHPVRLAEHVQNAMLSLPRSAAAVRRVLRSDIAAADNLGVRRTWLDATSPSAIRWRRGGCAMLRLLRARWIEACCRVAAPGVGGRPVAGGGTFACILDCGILCSYV